MNEVEKAVRPWLSNGRLCQLCRWEIDSDQAHVFDSPDHVKYVQRMHDEYRSEFTWKIRGTHLAI